ncbi:MAG: hypothetical protein ACXVXY_14045, partial [Mycobacteriaceae bacterium]
MAQYEAIFRLCYLHGPAGIIQAGRASVRLHGPITSPCRKRAWSSRLPTPLQWPQAPKNFD